MLQYMRPSTNQFFVPLVLLLCSCESQEIKQARKPTLAYWDAFVFAGKTAKMTLGDSPSGRQVAATYTQVGNNLAALPTLNVDPALVKMVHRFGTDFRELGHVYDRISTRHEDIGYGVGKLAESFLRGLMGDPFGATKEEMEDIQRDQAQLEVIKGKLRQNVSALTSLRSQLSAKYGIEFIVPDDL